MKNEEVADLVNKYFRSEGYEFPDYFEHRYEKDSSAIMYSFIRHFKPQMCVEIGTSKGGSTCVISAALQKNALPYIHIGSEIADDLRNEARENCFRKNGVYPYMIGDITQNLDKIPKALDFVFMDHDHDTGTTDWIFKNIVPRLIKGGILCMHDWAVEEKNGELIGKGEEGIGGWDETNYIMDLLRNNKLPVKKLCWTWKNPIWDGMSEHRESAWWLWKKD